jgi:hypothetical protein
MSAIEVCWLHHRWHAEVQPHIPKRAVRVRAELRGGSGGPGSAGPGDAWAARQDAAKEQTTIPLTPGIAMLQENNRKRGLA